MDTHIVLRDKVKDFENYFEIDTKPINKLGLFVMFIFTIVTWDFKNNFIQNHYLLDKCYNKTPRFILRDNKWSLLLQNVISSLI